MLTLLDGTLSNLTINEAFEPTTKLYGGKLERAFVFRILPVQLLFASNLAPGVFVSLDQEMSDPGEF